MTHHEAALRGLVERFRALAKTAAFQGYSVSELMSRTLTDAADQLEALLTAPAPPALLVLGQDWVSRVTKASGEEVSVIGGDMTQSPALSPHAVWVVLQRDDEGIGTGDGVRGVYASQQAAEDAIASICAEYPDLLSRRDFVVQVERIKNGTLLPALSPSPEDREQALCAAWNAAVLQVRANKADDSGAARALQAEADDALNQGRRLLGLPEMKASMR